MDELVRDLKCKYPDIMDVRVLGSSVLVLVPEVTDKAEDIIFSTIGRNAVVATLEGYAELTSKIG